jgi:hypothetical protein
MSNTQPNVDGSVQKTQKRNQLLWTLWCIFVLSLWGFSHALDRYHENMKQQQKQGFAWAIDRTIKPQPAVHFAPPSSIAPQRDRPSGSQADAIVHQLTRKTTP